MSPITLFRLAGSAVALFFAFAVKATALDWKTTTLNVATVPFQAELDVVFEFTNRSTKPVAVRELETSCSCIVADSDLKLYGPGTSGKITARFTVGDRGGLYERTITVITDEPGSPVYLTLRVEVPDIAAVVPRSVEWKLNEEPAEKIVEFKTLAGVEIIFSGAQSTSEVYAVRLESIEPGRLYRLHIKPNHTRTPVSAAIRVTGREKTGHDVIFSAYASIHP